MDVLKFVIRIIILLLIPAVVAIGTYVYMSKRFYEPMEEGNAEPVYIQVEATDSLSTIADKMKDASLIRNSWVMGILSRLRSGQLAIKAGEYEFSRAMTPKEILEKLAEGEIFVRKVTLEPGTSIWEIGAYLQEQDIVSAEEFDAAVVNLDLLSKAGIRAESFEGYLGPGEYEFTRGENGRSIVWKMMERSELNWDSNVYNARMQELNLNRHEVLTLASLIQEESDDPAIQQTISAVFHKKLNALMKLRSDPSVLYGLEERGQKLIPEHFMKSHPYNTYMNYGLPPAPVSNPGKRAIEAALYPDDSKYLFFTRDPQTDALLFFEDEKEYRKAFTAYKQGLAERNGGALVGEEDEGSADGDGLAAKQVAP